MFGGEGWVVGGDFVWERDCWLNEMIGWFDWPGCLGGGKIFRGEGGL